MESARNVKCAIRIANEVAFVIADICIRPSAQTPGEDLHSRIDSKFQKAKRTITVK
jgi:hypothetical protein